MALAQISTLNDDGDATLVSQGFGLGIRQHNDVMLAYGYSRYVKHELTLADGEFMILRLDVGNINQHHAENRFVGSEAGSLRVKIYDTTGSEGLYPASPIAMTSINQKGPIVETPGVDVVGAFFNYAANLTDPFNATLTAIDNDPLWTDAGGGPVDPSPAQFPEVQGRYYLANKTIAVVIENISGDPTTVTYRYQWHEY